MCLYSVKHVKTAYVKTAMEKLRPNVHIAEWIITLKNL